MSVDNDIEDFQRGIREVAQIACGIAAENMIAYLRTANPDPEIAVKIFNALKGTAQAEPANKVDPNAGLATFHIEFINGGVMQVAAPSTPPEIVQEVQPARLPEPTPLLLEHLSVNADLEALLAELPE